jgi:hypothetical protein
MYSMHIAPDGSLVTGGTLYAGAITTPNHLYRGTTQTEDWAFGGPSVCIFRRDLERIRFSSPIQATGVTQLLPSTRHEGENYLFASGTVAGRHRVVAVSLATREQLEGSGERSQPPLIDPLQEQFGGGATDGYLLLFEW